MLKTRGTTDEHGWTLIEEEIKAPEIKPEVRAALAVQSYQCPSVFIRGSSGFQHFVLFPEFQMPFLGLLFQIDVSDAPGYAYCRMSHFARI